VFENRLLRRIFGSKRDEVTGGWIKLHNEELHRLYSSPSIIKIIKSVMLKWSGHVARMGGRGMQKVRDHLEDLDVGRWTILKLNLER
jgi:hypothetical protein